MTKRNQHAKVYRGDSAQIVVTVTQADGSAYDPTIGALLRYRMARTAHASDDESLVRKSSAAGDGITSTPLGAVTIVLNPENTDFEPGVYYHELKVWDGTDVATAMVGAFVIRRSIPMGDRISPVGNIKLSAVAPTRTP